MPSLILFEKISSIHSQIAKEVEGDPAAIELYNGLVEAAVRYMSIRAEWELMRREEKMKNALLRTSSHNDLILQVNVLAQHLRQSGKPALWRDELEDKETDPTCREVIDDFARYLEFVHEIGMTTP